MVELLNAERAYILHMNLTSIITCYVDLKEQSKEKILVRILEAADSEKRFYCLKYNSFRNDTPRDTQYCISIKP